MQVFKVGNFSQNIEGFNPSRGDKLDFGNISVHSLILGNDTDGTATIVYPWQPNSFQRIEGVKWSDLTPDNFADVGNEHLRGDIGGVYSWENKLGPAFDGNGNLVDNNTVYIRSHEKNVGETVIEGFDPINDKINFLYFGTRERLFVENDGADMVIRSEPIGQSFRFIGVQREELIGQNIEFHFDQIVEDLLDRAFSFEVADLTLVSREGLYTPEGGPTDGFQERLGRFVRNDGTAPGVAQSEEESAQLLMTVGNMPMSMMMNSESVTGIEGGDGFQQAMQEVMSNMGMMGMGPSQNGIDIDVEGSTWFGGGFGGNLILRNTTNESITDWKVTFDAKADADAFQGWGGDFVVEDLGNGISRVTVTPKAWTATIPAGGEVKVNFNGQLSSGEGGIEVTSSNFFVNSEPMMGGMMNMPMDDPMTGMPMEDNFVPPMIMPMDPTNSGTTNDNMGSGFQPVVDLPMDPITGQIISVNGEFTLSSTEDGYTVQQGDNLVNLTNRNGSVFSESTNRNWDFVGVANRNRGGFRVLAEGENSRDGEYRIFRFNDDGELTGRGRWFDTSKFEDRNFEQVFSVDTMVADNPVI